MIRLKAVYLSDEEIRNILYSQEEMDERIWLKLKKTLESKEYSNTFEA